MFQMYSRKKKKEKECCGVQSDYNIICKSKELPAI